MDTIVMVAFFGPFILLALVEALWPANRYTVERSGLWMLKGLLWFASSFVISSYLPIWVDGWLAPFALFDLSSLGIWGTIPAILVFQLLGYGYHRALHAVPALWRLHQTHHSSERIDMFSAYVFHPLDIVGWTLVGSITAVGVTGVAVEAAVASALINNAMALLGHANLKTPRWLGYIVARPENHALHHARGVHHYNFADLPLIDMMFGTFRNPESFTGEAGFWDGASNRILTLVTGRPVEKSDAHAEPAANALNMT